jgi:hypothetical protein
MFLSFLERCKNGPFYTVSVNSALLPSSSKTAECKKNRPSGKKSAQPGHPDFDSVGSCCRFPEYRRCFIGK